MFLTKIELDPGRRLARKYLGSPQVMHAVVMKAAAKSLPDGPPNEQSSNEETGRILWRVDEGAFGTTLYLLSSETPDVSQLVLEAAASGTEARSLDYRPFLNRLADDQVWAFRLAANPAYAASRGPGARGKRYGHVTAEQQREWLLCRSAKNGFSILDSDGQGEVDRPGKRTDTASVLVVRRERPLFTRSRSDGDGRDRVTINRTVYEGLLRVTDAPVLRRILTSGLGPSKAYGCGLMTLARTRRP